MFAIQAEAVGANGSSSPALCRPEPPTGRQARRQEIVVSLVEAATSRAPEPITLSRADAYIAVVPLPRGQHAPAELGPVSFVDLRRAQPRWPNVDRNIRFYFPRPALKAMAEENG